MGKVRLDLYGKVMEFEMDYYERQEKENKSLRSLPLSDQGKLLNWRVKCPNAQPLFPVAQKGCIWLQNNIQRIIISDGLYICLSIKNMVEVHLKIYP